jgi:large subunit ribosomal protein L21
MYAVFQTGGKQFRAEPGVRLRVPSLPAEPGDKVTFDQVLLAGDEGQEAQVGTPVVEGASVTAEVIRHGRSKKVIVFKRKRRKNYRRKQGHRQGFTEIRIDDVALA